MQENKSNTGVKVSLLVLILAVIGYGGFKYFKADPTTTPTTTDTPVTTPVDTSTTTVQVDTTSYLYKDGDYSAIGSYYAPPGAEQIKVSLTLKDDVVTAVSIEPQTQNRESLNYQNRVAGSVSSLVVGKKIDSLSLNKVSGSSLTPKGFNDAIAKIKVAAKV